MGGVGFTKCIVGWCEIDKLHRPRERVLGRRCPLVGHDLQDAPSGSLVAGEPAFRERRVHEVSVLGVEAFRSFSVDNARLRNESMS